MQGYRDGGAVRGKRIPTEKLRGGLLRGASQGYCPWGVSSEMLSQCAGLSAPGETRLTLVIPEGSGAISISLEA